MKKCKSLFSPFSFCFRAPESGEHKPEWATSVKLIRDWQNHAMFLLESSTFLVSKHALKMKWWQHRSSTDLSEQEYIGKEVTGRRNNDSYILRAILSFYSVGFLDKTLVKNKNCSPLLLKLAAKCFQNSLCALERLEKYKEI